MTQTSWFGGAGAVALALFLAAPPTHAAMVTNLDAQEHVLEVQFDPDDPASIVVVPAGQTVEVCEKGGCIVTLNDKEYDLSDEKESVKIVEGRIVSGNAS